MAKKHKSKNREPFFSAEYLVLAIFLLLALILISVGTGILVLDWKIVIALISLLGLSIKLLFKHWKTR
ncbi:MAG: hypothetical protein COB78_04120 [Hyphomicrobiales bacterium]|nr:MAG: hypothetical protein COB78_04120 [Hyphomicrobiales bacterium]